MSAILPRPQRRVAVGVGNANEIVPGAGGDLVAPGAARDGVVAAAGLDGVGTPGQRIRSRPGRRRGTDRRRTDAGRSVASPHHVPGSRGAQHVVAGPPVELRPHGNAKSRPGPRTRRPVSASPYRRRRPVNAVVSSPSGAGGPQRASLGVTTVQKAPGMMAGPLSRMRTPSGSGTILSSFVSPGAAWKVTSSRALGEVAADVVARAEDELGPRPRRRSGGRGRPEPTSHRQSPENDALRH